MTMTRWVMMGCLLAGIATRVTAADPVDWVPRSVNAVAWIDVRAVHASPLAKAENWARQGNEAFLQGQSVVPPGVDLLVSSAELDLADGLRPLKEYVVARPKGGMTLETLASLVGSTMDTIDGRPALETDRGVVVVEAAADAWLAVGQGGRQAAARWLDVGSASAASTKLGKAIGARSPGSQFLLAIDLAHAISPNAVAPLLKEADPQLADARVETLAQLLATADIVRLSVRVDSDIRGHLEVDFNESTVPLAPLLQEFVPVVLQSLGAADAGGADWKWMTQGMKLVGDGPLTVRQVRRLMSVVHNPATEVASSPSSATAPAVSSEASPVVIASQRYYRSLRSITDDLRDTLKKTRDNHALWFERSARKIDDLPMRDVDPELLDFGARVSSSLLYQGQVQRTMNVRAGAYKAQTRAGNTYRYGYAGPYGGWAVTRETDVDPGAIDKTSNQQAAEVKFSEWKQIEEGFSAIRRRLTEKLMADF